jgi:hypothetical protein
VNKEMLMKVTANKKKQNRLSDQNHQIGMIKTLTNQNYFQREGKEHTQVKNFSNLRHYKQIE